MKKQSRGVRHLALVSVLALGVAGCGESQGDGGSGGETSAGGSSMRSFTGDNGEVQIPEKPKRVVATGYAVPALLEANAPLVGIQTWRRGVPMMTPEVKQRYDKTAKVAGETAKETNYEAIAKAKPDLIIIGVPQPVQKDIDMERLKSIAPVVSIGPSVPKAWKTLNEKQLDAAGMSGHLKTSKAAYTKKANALKTKYASVLGSMKFGHVGAYSDPGKGNFQREYSGSWGTNIAEDIGVTYYGQVKKKMGGSGDVSETPAIEELPKSLGEADAITYTVAPDGKVPPTVTYVLNSSLWKQLPAVKAKKTFPLQFTEAATYGQASKTLDDVDKKLAPLLKTQ